MEEVLTLIKMQLSFYKDEKKLKQIKTLSSEIFKYAAFLYTYIYGNFKASPH